MGLPIPVLLGAALLLLAGKKKKSAASGIPATTPPPIPVAEKKTGSGYPGVTRERMQQIQTMLVANGYDVGRHGLDGRYGPSTKQAVWEFQEDWGGLTVDGKPGSKTQSALEEAEAMRIDSMKSAAKTQPAAQVMDLCNPLDPATWSAGSLCYFDGSRWALRKGELSKNALPPISAKEVGFSADYSKIVIGSQFQHGVLDPWLNNRRKEGLLVTKYHGPTFMEYFSDNPTSFLSQVFGVGKTRGELLYATLYVMATGGVGFGARAIQKAATKMAQSVAVKASTYGPMTGMLEKTFGTDAEGAAASAAEAFAAFSKTNSVTVGSKKVKIAALPSDKNSVKSLSKYIMDYIIKFQKMHF